VYGESGTTPTVLYVCIIFLVFLSVKLATFSLHLTFNKAFEREKELERIEKQKELERIEKERDLAKQKEEKERKQKKKGKQKVQEEGMEGDPAKGKRKGKPKSRKTKRKEKGKKKKQEVPNEPNEQGKQEVVQNEQEEQEEGNLKEEDLAEGKGENLEGPSSSVASSRRQTIGKAIFEIQSPSTMLDPFSDLEEAFPDLWEETDPDLFGFFESEEPVDGEEETLQRPRAMGFIEVGGSSSLSSFLRVLIFAGPDRSIQRPKSQKAFSVSD